MDFIVVPGGGESQPPDGLVNTADKENQGGGQFIRYQLRPGLP